MESVAPVLGRTIRAHRLACGLSQEQLAEASQLHWTYISQIERGKRNLTVDALVRIAGALGLPAWRLLQEALVTPEAPLQRGSAE